MSLKIPTFWIFIGKKLLSSPQNTANLRYNKVNVQTSVVQTGANSFC